MTHIARTVIRLVHGEGTLVIELDDPSTEVSINGEDVTIRGGGVKELTLRPGEYRIAASKDGRPIRQELVTIERNGRSVVRLSLEPAAHDQPGVISNDAGASPADLVDSGNWEW